MSKRYTDLHDLARLLQRDLLPKKAVFVKRVKLPSDTWADCNWNANKKRFDVRIDRKVSEQYAVFFLMHEFAHILSWDQQQKDHGVSWGRAMSKVYCVYLKWIAEDSGTPQKKAACLKPKALRVLIPRRTAWTAAWAPQSTWR